VQCWQSGRERPNVSRSFHFQNHDTRRFGGIFIGGLMTDFEETEMRKKCRKCRSKLATPTSNEREGFCCRGCYNAFYRKHCRVCEAEIEQPKRGERILCKRPKCRTLWDAKSGFGRYAPFGAESISEVPANQAVLSAPKTVEWRIIAGPALTPSQFHCATVPDGQDCQWKGGDFERIEAKNRAALEAAEKAEIEANGYFSEPEWQEYVSPDACELYHGRSYVTRFRDANFVTVTKLPPIPDDLSIPDFLLRRQEPLAMAA
jgi:hypothetical protein